MERSGKLWLVANGASGSNDDEAFKGLVTALGEAGSKPARVVDLQTDRLPDRATLESEDVATLAIFGGDGSANAVVTGIEGWAGQVLLLPGGTANLLARALHGERTVAQIVAAFGAGSLCPLTRNCIRTSRGAALVEVLAGPGATWSEVREGMREGTISETASLAVEAVRQSAVGPMVAIVDPALGRESGYPGVRLALAPDGMTVDGYGVDTAGDYLKQGIALLKRDFREGPHDELGAHREILCRSADGSPIALMIDGERRSGGGEERFSLAPLRVSLLGTPHG